MLLEVKYFNFFLFLVFKGWKKNVGLLIMEMEFSLKGHGTFTGTNFKKIEYQE